MSGKWAADAAGSSFPRVWQIFRDGGNRVCPERGGQPAPRVLGECGYGPGAPGTITAPIYTTWPAAVAAMAEFSGPVYMRLLRGQVPVVLDPASYRFELGRARLLRDGDDVALISTGLMTSRALEAASRLALAGIQAAVLHISTLKPFDREAVLNLLGKVNKAVAAENHASSGGLDSAVADAVVDVGLAIRLARVGIPDCCCVSGSIPYLVRRYGFDADSIAAVARCPVDGQGSR